MIRAILCAVALLLGFPATARTIPAGELKAMLASGQAVIELDDNDVEFVRQVFQPAKPVTIKGGRFREVILDQWKDVTFEGSTFSVPNPTASYSSALLLYDPSNIRLVNCEITGAEVRGELWGVGVSVRGGSNVSVTGSRFSSLSIAGGFARTAGTRILRNDVSAVREGFQFAAGTLIEIVGNRIADFRPVAGDHPDGVQFMTGGLDPAVDSASSDVVIMGNLIISDPGRRAQGIFFRDELALHEKGRGYKRVTISNNLVIGTAYHGITLADPAEAVAIEGNIVAHVPGDSATANWIMANDGSVANNQANRLSLGVRVKQAGNAVTGPASEADKAQLERSWLSANRPTAVSPAPPATLKLAKEVRDLINQAENALGRAVARMDKLQAALAPQ